MYPIALVNMPFAGFDRPSIALTQLRSVLKSSHPEKVNPQLFYFNHDFAEFLGPEVFNSISNSFMSVVCGLGDWFFAGTAFPDAPDTTKEFLTRHPRSLYGRSEQTEQTLLAKRGEVSDFLDALIDRYGLDKYRLVGMTTMFQQNVASLALAKKLKERDPSIIVVLGGANCETPMGQALVKNFDSIDFAFSGPGLISFPKFVGHLLEGQEEKCHQIRGVFSRRKLGLNYIPAEIGEELPLNVEVDLDYDDYLDDLDRRREVIDPDKFKIRLTFETSRGCWWGERMQCTFCGLNGSTMNYRTMPPPMALKQFEKLFRYAPRISIFECVDNILAKEYLTEVFPYIRSPKPIFYEVKADLKDEDFDVLTRAGVKYMQPGIEALTTPTLKLMKKGTTAFQNLRFLKNCSRCDVKPAWGLLLGFPGQQESCYQKLERDLHQLHHLPPPQGAVEVRFERFSPYFDHAKDYNLDLITPMAYAMIYPIPGEELKNLAYFFQDQNYNAPYLRLNAKWIQKIHNLVMDWHRRWRGLDGKLKPQLIFVQREFSRVIHDTRSGALKEIELDDISDRILQVLTAPMSQAGVARQLPEIPPAQLEEAMTRLRDLDLLFEEGNRLMSLVVQPTQVSVPATEMAEAK